MTTQSHVRHRLAPAAAVPAGLTAAMVALLWLTGNSWFLLLAGSGSAMLVHAALSRARIADLRVEAQQALRVAVGQELVSVIRIVNEGRCTSTPVSMSLRTRGLADASVYVGPLRPGDVATVETRRLALHRGVTDSAEARMVARPALGLVRGRSSRHFAHHVIVHPEPAAPRSRARTTRPSDDGAAESRGPGSDVFGLREWRAGDDKRHVHWRSTARHQRLVIIERAVTSLPSLRLVLIGPPPAEGFEAALADAAAVCDLELRAGRSITVGAWLSRGLELAPCADRLSLLDWWASLTDVDVPDPSAFASSVGSVFGRGELIVAGPAPQLDAWLPVASQWCPDLRLRRLADTP